MSVQEWTPFAKSPLTAGTEMLGTILIHRPRRDRPQSGADFSTASINSIPAISEFSPVKLKEWTRSRGFYSKSQLKA
jgi:hypothetical protein